VSGEPEWPAPPFEEDAALPDDWLHWVNFNGVDRERSHDASLVLRILAEKELFRHCWMSRTALVPVQIWTGKHLRQLAEAIDGKWGDYDALRENIRGRWFWEVLELVDRWPHRSVGWCLKTIAFVDSLEVPDDEAPAPVPSRRRRGSSKRLAK
jgi:hypothetical protein